MSETKNGNSATEIEDEIKRLKAEAMEAFNNDKTEEFTRINVEIEKAKTELKALDPNNPKAPEVKKKKQNPGETKDNKSKSDSKPPKINNLEDGTIFNNFYAYKEDANGERIDEKFDMQKDFFNLLTDIPDAYLTEDQKKVPAVPTVKKSPQITPAMLLALKSKDYTHVSRTQFHALPHILQHYDPSKSPAEQMPGNHCVIQGPAGTGKTMTFIVGAVAQIDPTLKKPQVLIINHAVDLAEQNQQQCDLLCWDSVKAEGGNVLYNYVNCGCKKGIPNEDHTCKKDKRSRLSSIPTAENNFETKKVEIESGKLVAGMKHDWQKLIALRDGKSNYPAQFVSMSKGVLQNILKKKMVIGHHVLLNF